MNFLDQVVQITKKKYLGKSDFSSENISNLSHQSELLFEELLKDFLVIAECKKASPSKGVIQENYDVTRLVRAYEKSGAKAISILTEEKYFLGSFKHIEQARKATSLPILCKDFIVSEEQVLKAKHAGASLVLLIARILSTQMYLKLANLISKLGMLPLVEIFDYAELKTALKYEDKFILGINNRNLTTLAVDVKHAVSIKKEMDAAKIIIPTVCESGIKSPEEVKLLRENGFRGILVGEHLLLQENQEAGLKNLLNIH